ncbi:MAG: hypothetical protein CMH97_00885 [Oceanospirillaceae bacterium]|nr:hypothetical protein [Oceanospirillaceae bacterium]
MKASELAKKFAVNVNTVRHYVRSGLLKPEKDASGYHRFGHDEVRQLSFILRARALGFTLDVYDSCFLMLSRASLFVRMRVN